MVRPYGLAQQDAISLVCIHKYHSHGSLVSPSSELVRLTRVSSSSLVLDLNGYTVPGQKLACQYSTDQFKPGVNKSRLDSSCTPA